MINSRDLLQVILWLVWVVFLIDLVLALFVFVRRFARGRFFKAKDAACDKYRSAVDALVQGKSSTTALETLRQGRSRPERDAICELILAWLPDARESATAALMHLGYLSDWARTAFGRRRARQLYDHMSSGVALPPASPRRLMGLRRRALFAVPRATAVARLARLAPATARPFMMEALGDPSPLVARVNVIGLGRNRHPDVVPILLQELNVAVTDDARISIRTLKTALARYSVESFVDFLPYLSAPNARMRFLVVDTMREICARDTAGQIPDSISQQVIDHSTRDESPDVRARAAQLLRYLPASGAAGALSRLLRDENEFVRLHAVRACMASQFACLKNELLRCITDRRWRVREAAVEAIASAGDTGLDQLAEQFLATNDRYASEQIAEHLQRSGAMDALLASLAADSPSRSGGEVCRKLHRLGKVSLLFEAVENHSDPRVRERLFELLAGEPLGAAFVPVLKRLSVRGDDLLKPRAASLLARLTLVLQPAIAEGRD